MEADLWVIRAWSVKAIITKRIKKLRKEREFPDFSNVVTRALQLVQLVIIAFNQLAPFLVCGRQCLAKSNVIL